MHVSSNELGHIRRDCAVRNQGNEQGGQFGRELSPVDVVRAAARVNGRERKVLVDTGCSFTLVGANIIQERWKSREEVVLETTGGGKAETRGSVWIKSLVVNGAEVGGHELCR